MNVKDIRRKNLRTIIRNMGGVTKFAEHIERSQSQISHLVSRHPKKNLGDRLAAHIEKVLKKTSGWLDHEHDLEEEGAPYRVGSKRDIHRVPIISWNDAEQIAPEFDSLEIEKKNYPYLVTHLQVSPQAFALRVEGDSMEAPQGISFCNGAIIVVDPELPAKNNSFVIAKANHTSQLAFKQLVIDGHRRYFKPLNARYPITEITPHTLICGVVRMMTVELK